MASFAPPVDLSLLRNSLEAWSEGTWLKMQNMFPPAALEAVQAEAVLLLEILGFVEVVVSPEEVKGTFHQSPLEVHLAEALLAARRISDSSEGDEFLSAEGREDLPEMIQALRAAAAAGSAWAPLWLGDLCLLCPQAWDTPEGEDDTNQQITWYEQAASRGHPEAFARLYPSEEHIIPLVPTGDLSERQARLESEANACFKAYVRGPNGASQVLLVEKEDEDEDELPDEEDEEGDADEEDVEPPPRLRRAIAMLRASSDASDAHEQKEILAMFGARRPPKSRL